MEILVIGGGYVGITTATCLAREKNNVILMEIDKKRVATLQNDDLPIFEPGLDSLYKKAREDGKITVTDSYKEAIKNSEISMVCVGTPQSERGDYNLDYMRSAIEGLGTALRGKKERHTIVVRSTVPPGTSREMLATIEYNFSNQEHYPNMAMHPEHLVEGSAVHDFLNPAKIIVGQEYSTAGDAVLQAYYDAKILKKGDPRICRLSLEEAETEKLLSNSWLASDITLTNESANICDAVGVDFYKVIGAVLKDPRLGNRKFTRAGPGYGGSCFPKDVAGLTAFAETKGYKAEYFRQVMKTNKAQPRIVAEELHQRYLSGFEEKRVGVLGVTFKGDTDDLRETPIKPLIEELKKLGKGKTIFRISDPFAKRENVKNVFGMSLKDMHDVANWADLLIVGSDHSQYQGQDFINMLYAKEHNGGHVFDAKNSFGGKFKAVGRWATEVVKI